MPAISPWGTWSQGLWSPWRTSPAGSPSMSRASPGTTTTTSPTGGRGSSWPPCWWTSTGSLTWWSRRRRQGESGSLSWRRLPARSPEVLDRIPQGGYLRDFLEEVLAGTPYQGIIAHARYLCHDTGSWFLDLVCEELLQDPPEWDRGTVEALTEHWRHAQAVEEEADTFFQWLEEDPQAHLAEVVGFLERRWRGKRKNYRE